MAARHERPAVVAAKNTSDGEYCGYSRRYSATTSAPEMSTRNSGSSRCGQRLPGDGRSAGIAAPISERVSSWVLPIIIGMPGRLRRRIRIERMTRERALVEHRAHVDSCRARCTDPRCARRRDELVRHGRLATRRLARSVAEFLEHTRVRPARVQRTRSGELLAAHGGGAVKQAAAAGIAMSVAIFAPPPD